MSRRSTHTSAGVSLFPFLAVLVCTMGSLILLLLVTTKRARAVAVQKAKVAVAPAIPDPSSSTPLPTPLDTAPSIEQQPEADPNAALRQQIETFQRERDALRDRVAALQSELETLRTTALRSKVKTDLLQSRLAEVRHAEHRLSAERDARQAELARLQDSLRAAEARLAEAVEQQRSAGSEFAFLPFDGRTGTTRRPILIECTQEYIRFLPEDVRITAADLDGFTPGFNPLLVAARELAHYWTAYDRARAGITHPSPTASTFENDLAAFQDSDHQPYVLLLVRSNGAVAFHTAKSCLTQLKIPHGYELVTDDMQFDVSSPDPDAKAICQAAVDQVLAEREKVIRAVIANRALGEDQLRFKPNERAFVPREPPDPISRFSRPSAPGTSSGDRVAADSDGRDSGSLGATGWSSPSRNPRAAAAVDPGGASANGKSKEPEPEEVRLPDASARRFPDDGSKPFPFGQRTRRTSSTAPTTSDRHDHSRSTGPDPRGSAAPPGTPSTSANRASSSGKSPMPMKRRYVMPRSGIGLEKAIPLKVSASHIVVDEKYEIRVTANVSTESLVDRVLLAMDRVQDDWPNPGSGYHWVPTVRFEVVPGGEQVHQRVNSALSDLGLTSSVEFLKNDSTPDERTRKSGLLLPAPPGGAR
jgi:hypothetical protein